MVKDWFSHPERLPEVDICRVLQGDVLHRLVLHPQVGVKLHGAQVARLQLYLVYARELLNIETVIHTLYRSQCDVKPNYSNIIMDMDSHDLCLSYIFRTNVSVLVGSTWFDSKYIANPGPYTERIVLRFDA